jgi:putative ABC transport system permease protein
VKKMSRFFYQKLAINNMKKNSKTLIPYILACIGTIMMFYNMVFLVVAKDIGSVSDSEDVRYILFLGAIVIGIFSLIFLFYTNSFLIKRRKKEFGLFNVLGMEKKHIARIMFYESLFTALISIALGLIAGILLSKLIILLLFKLITFNATFGFEMPIIAVIISISLFLGIFLVNLLYNIRQVHLSNAIELLKGGNVGEKEPKTKWLLTIIGVLCLGVGYYIAVTTESPLAALNLFFVAVLLVIIGTYCLFTTGSIAVLKMLRKNKKYYYIPKHFISVSSMIYRMKQNAAGLANICILSTAVIIIISSTMSLYMGVEDAIRTRYPSHIIVNLENVSDENAAKIDELILLKTKEAKLIQKDVVKYRSMEYLCMQDGNNFSKEVISFKAVDNIAVLGFITLDEYNKMEGKNVKLNKGEILLYSFRGNIQGDEINLNGLKLSVKERIDTLNSFGSNQVASLSNSYLIVIDGMDSLNEINSSLTGKKLDESLNYYYGFNINGDKQSQINLINSLKDEIYSMESRGYVEGPEITREGFYAIYGGLFFLGIFLGLLFIMATVLIIYYKQIAEGFDDKERFEIMQKVGLSRDEVKKSIKSQVLTVFFLPLFTAVIHIAFAFKVITRLLNIFNLTNVPLFALCTTVTIIVFAVFYLIVYIFTAKTYYKIVS